MVNMPSVSISWAPAFGHQDSECPPLFSASVTSSRNAWEPAFPPWDCSCLGSPVSFAVLPTGHHWPCHVATCRAQWALPVLSSGPWWLPILPPWPRTSSLPCRRAILSSSAPSSALTVALWRHRGGLSLGHTVSRGRAVGWSRTA